MRNPIQKTLLLALFLVFAAPLAADTILLRNGARINGKIVAQTRTLVRIQTSTGVKTFQKTGIRRIIFGRVDDKAEEEARKKQAEARKKQLEEFKKRQEEFQKRQEEARKQQEELQKARQEAAEAERRRAAEAEAERIQAEQAASMEGALWRSILFPGWGQFRQRRPGAGTAYAAGFVLAALATGSAGGAYSQSQGRYAAAVDNLSFQTVVLGFGMPFYDRKLRLLDELLLLQYMTTQERNAAFRDSQRSAAAVNVAGGVMGAIYIFNLMDVIVFRDGGLALGVFGEEDRAGLRVEFTF